MNQLTIDNEINRKILGEYMGIKGIENLTGNSGTSGDAEPEILTIVSNVGTYEITPNNYQSTFACNPDESAGLAESDPSAPGDVGPDGNLV